MSGVLVVFAGWMAAASPQLSVRWSAPAECPDAATVEAEILARATGVDRVDVVGSVANVDGVFVLALEVRTPNATLVRHLESPDCSELATATALITAIAVDPQRAPNERVVEPPPPAPPTVPLPADPLTVRTVRAPSPSPSITTRSEPTPLRVSPFARAFGGGSAGILPGFGGGLGIALGVTAPRWRVEAQGSHWFATESMLPSDVGGSFHLWSAGARGCPVLHAARFEFPLCMGVEAGAIVARGRGGRSQMDVTRPWAAMVAGPAAQWVPRPWLALHAGVDGLLALTRPGYTAEIGSARPELHRVAPVAVRLLAAVELRIPGAHKNAASRRMDQAE